MHVKIADGDSDAVAELTRKLDTGLFRIRCAQIPGFVVPEARIHYATGCGRRRHLTRRRKITERSQGGAGGSYCGPAGATDNISRSNCATNRWLNKASPQGLD